MSRFRARDGWVFLVAMAVFSAGGCNWITGADTLVASEDYVDPFAEDDGSTQGPQGTGATQGSGAGETSGQTTGVGGASTSSTGAGAGTSSATGTGGASSSSGVGGASTSSSTASSSSASSGSGGGGGGPPPPPPPPVGDAADGVTITDVKLYQGLEVPIMNASSSIPIVAGKDAMVRVFYTVDGGYDNQPVTGRFSAGQYYAEESQVLSGSSSQSSLSSTVNIQVPGYMLTSGGTFRVDLVQPNGAGTNSGAGYPQGTQQIALGAQSSGDKLKVLLIPVKYYGSLPDTSPGQVAKYVDFFEGHYPVPNVEVTVRSQPYEFSGNLSGYNGWSNLLDKITNLRNTDNAPSDVYYYGIHDANGSGLLGLGWIGGKNDVWSRTAIGVGWTGNTAPETAVHELGHNHGRSHAPCGVSGDPYYPHPGASIGVWGYNPTQKKLLSPSKYVDFMSYCSPSWVSDYTYKALFKRLKHINGAKIYYPPELLNRTWDRVKVIDGKASFLTPMKMSVPPVGEEKTVMVTTANGTKKITGHYYAYNHIEGGVLYVLRPKLVNLFNLVWKVSFQAEGKTLNLLR